MNCRKIMRLLMCAVLVLIVGVSCVLVHAGAASQTLYVDSSLGSDSYSGTNTRPYKTFDKALSSVGSTDTKIVIKRDYTISGDYTEPEHTGTVTITCNSGKKIIFDNTTGADFATYRLNGPTAFESVTISLSDHQVFAAQHNPIVFGLGVSITNGEKYAFVVGGYETPAADVATDLDSSITISSGSFYKICGFTRTKGAKSLTFTGTATITFNGGSVVDLYGASLYNHYSGSADITVNGGTITNLYAGGDGTRRLNGDAVVTLNGGTVSNVNINNVIGNATLNLTGACPSAVSVSYASDTIKTLAEKAGSAKTANYNAVVCSESVVASLGTNFDIVNNNTVVYVGAGNGNGSSASNPMASFSAAYAKIAGYGGTLYIVGECALDADITNNSYTEPVRIVGYGDGAVLSIQDGGTLDLWTDTTIDGLTLASAGGASVVCHSGNIAVGSDVDCSGSIALCASAEADANAVCNIAGGSFSRVTGSSASMAGSITINVTGGSITTLVGAETNARNIRIELASGNLGSIISAGGTVLGKTTFKLADGAVGKLTAGKTTGETIVSIASASVSSFDLTSLSLAGTSTLVLGKGATETEFDSVLSSFDTVKRENAVYVADGGTGNGLSALTPTGDINSALAILGGEGRIVISGKVSIVNHLGIKAHSYPLTITSVDSDNDYRNVAAIDMDGNIVLGGETLFENVNFTCPNSNVFIYGNEKKLTIGGGVDTTLTNANTSYINISGGGVDNKGNGDGDITVNSGNWGKFRGGSVKYGTVTKSRSAINVTINGGTFHGYFILGSRGNVYGDINFTVNDGTFMQGIYGVYEQDTVVYDRYFDYTITMTINSGVFYADIAPARSKTTELHGSYTVYLNGGEYHGLTDLCGTEGFAGDMTSSLTIAANVNTKATETGEVSFTNYLRRNNADPWLFYRDGYYYYTCTGASTVSLIKTANIGDIKTASAKVILRPTDGGVNMWSPEIHYFSAEEVGEGNEGWYLFIGHDDGTTANQRQYVAKCLDGDDLMGRWGDPVTGEVNGLRRVTFPDSPESNVTAFSGGMSVLRANGKTYITFVSEVGRDTADFHQTLNIVEMENPWTMKGKPVVICEPEYDWEAGGSGYSESISTWYPKVVEGASAVYSDNGDVYLMYTGSGYWTIYYQLGYLKLTGTDPMLRSSWTKNPNSIFSLSEEINGCGHASYFKDHNGDYWACYHGYIGKDTSSKRFSFVERIYVTSDGVSIGNGSGHPAPLSTEYTLSVNPLPLEDKIHSFGTVEKLTNTIIIDSPEDLLELMNTPEMWGEIIKLGCDIDLTQYTGTLTQMPIGNTLTPFTGEFDGCGYSIRGISITASGSVGLFGRISGGAYVGNFTAHGSVTNNGAATSAESTDADGNYYTTGGIIGTITGGRVENVTSYVNVSGKGNVGGVIGIVYVSDDSTVTVRNCINHGSITNKYGNTGGVIGRIQAKGSASRGVLVSGCRNYADVTSTSSDRCRVAGIVGYVRIETQTVIIEFCSNFGDITGNNTATATNNIPHVGGIAGRCEITSGELAGLIIRDCRNTGDIYTRVRAGGIVGIITRSATCTAESGIYRCENRGKIIGSFNGSTVVNIGGIAGYIDNNHDALNLVVSDCVNYAEVSCMNGKGYVGGIIGGQDSTDLYRCVNYGMITGHSDGFVGAITGVEVNDGKYRTESCYALEGTAAALYGYQRTTYCTHKSNVFVSEANKKNTASYSTLDFDSVYTMGSDGVLLSVHTGILAGDLDGDGVVTNADITILVRCLSGWDVDTDPIACDLNGDGKLNNRDAIALIVKLSEIAY